jgi:hypothetical protein
MTLLFFPILVEAYDYGFVIPALGPLFAAAALAAGGPGAQDQRRKRRRIRAAALAQTPLHETRETSLERLAGGTVHELQ